MDFLFHCKVKTRKSNRTGALVFALLFLSGCSRSETYSITFGGDIILARGGEPLVEVWQSIGLSLPKNLGNSSGGNYYAAALESPLANDYITDNIANPEMNLCAESREIQILSNSDLDILTFNNNHQNDCSDHGALETQHLLEESGFSPFQQSEGIWVSNFPDSQFTIIAVDVFSGQMDEDAITRIIHEEKSDGKLVIVSAHWGNEYQAGPDDKQQSLAQTWVDAGADVIWGHHPHVLQRVEWLTSNEDKHTALVMYSLGNLLADQFMLEDAKRSALVRLEIKNGQIIKITVLPVEFNWEKKSLNFDLQKDEIARILDRLNLESDKSSSVEVYSPGD